MGNHKQHSVKQCGVNCTRVFPSLEPEVVGLVKGRHWLVSKLLLSHPSFEEEKGRKSLHYPFIHRVM